MSRSRSFANFRLAQACHVLGDYRLAVGFARRNVAALSGDLLYERFLGATLSSVASRWSLVLALAELGEFTEGIVHGQEAIRIAEQSGHLTTLLHAYNCLGLICLLKGDIQQALPVLEHGLEHCQAGDVPIWPPGFAAALGVAYALSDRLVEALTLLEQTKEQTVARGITHYPALWDTRLSEIYLLSGRLEEASALCERALVHSRTQKGQGHEAYTLCLLGDIAVRCKPSESTMAKAHYQQALALADTLGMRPLQAHCHHSLGTLYAKAGQWEQARAALSTAITLSRAMEMTFWLPQAEAILAEEP